MEPRFDPATASGDPGSCLPGCHILRDALFARWQSYRGDAGCYLHNGTTDGGSPSFHSRGRAIDIWITTGHLEVGEAIFDWCYENRNLIGLNEVIFNSKIWRADNLGHGIHAYTVNRHTDHIHIALNLDGARAELPWFGGNLSQPIPNPEEDFMANMSDEEKKLLLDAARIIKGTVDPFIGELKSNTPEDAIGRRHVGILPLLRNNVVGFIDEMKKPGPQPWSNWFGRND